MRCLSEIYLNTTEAIWSLEHKKLHEQQDKCRLDSIFTELKLIVINSSYWNAFLMRWLFLVYFLNICVWTKGEVAISEVSPDPWRLRRLFVLLLPAAAVHLNCIWLSAFFSCQKGRRNYMEGSKPTRETQSISLHFVILWVCVAACLKHLPLPPPPTHPFPTFGQ